MWTISKLKEEAKRTLKQFGYWMPLLVTFLTGIIVGGSSGSAGGSFSNSTGYKQAVSYTKDLSPAAFAQFIGDYFNAIGEKIESFFSNPFTNTLLLMTVVFMFMFVLVIAFGWSAFVSGPVIVGKNRYFMEHRAFETKLDRLVWSFRRGRYLNTVKIIFFMHLKIFLWSLLFVIPGIIKSYEYSMVPYILAENPQISMERAFELSRKMTDGEKWHIFCLNLSFIGWYLLGFLCCCVGTIFVDPYKEASFAELYQVLREKAHGLGFSDFNELPGFFPEQP